MKKIDVYEIVIKLFGIYLLVPITNHITYILNNLLIKRVSDDVNIENVLKASTLASIVGVLVLIMIMLIFVFKTEYIAQLITSKKDIEGNVNLFVPQNVIYEIVILVTGVFMLFWSLPDMLFNIYNYVSFTNRHIEMPRQAQSFIASLVKLLTGLLMILSARPLSKLFSKSSE